MKFPGVCHFLPEAELLRRQGAGSLVRRGLCEPPTALEAALRLNFSRRDFKERKAKEPTDDSQAERPPLAQHRPSSRLARAALQLRRASSHASAMAPRLNIPPVTRVILIVLIFQSVLSAAIRYRTWTENAHVIIPYMTLVPQLSIIYPWTFITSTLVEGNVFTLAIAGVTLYQGGRYLERAWSSAELAKFLALVSVIPNVLTFLVMIILFTLTRSESWTCVCPRSYLSS